MRQQCCDVACFVGRQAGQDVLEICMRFVSVELRRSEEAHDRSGALASAQRPSEQPVGPADGSWTYLILDPIVVDWYMPVFQITRQRLRAL